MGNTGLTLFFSVKTLLLCKNYNKFKQKIKAFNAGRCLIKWQSILVDEPSTVCLYIFTDVVTLNRVCWAKYV